MRHSLTFALATAAMFAVLSASATAQSFEGRKKCSSCHKSQAESWGQTAHSKAMDSLKPNTKAEAKKKAKLDPKKDYTKDKDCVGCHVDGWGKEGGYTIEDPSKFTSGVGCESCHGPGSKYRGMHRKAGAAYEKSKKTAPRSTLAEAGQDFKFEVLARFRQGRTGCGLLRFLIGRARLAVHATVFGARPVAGFAAYTTSEFAGVLYGVAAFLAPAVNVTTHAVLVLGVVFLGIELGLLLGFSLGVGLERVHGLGMGGLSPGFSLALVAGTAFLATFKRLSGRAGG